MVLAVSKMGVPVMRGTNTLISAIFVVAVMVFGHYATRDWALAQFLWLEASTDFWVINRDNGAFVLLASFFGSFVSWIGWYKYSWLTLLSAALAVTAANSAYVLGILSSNASTQGMEVAFMGLLGLAFIGMSCEASAADLSEERAPSEPP